MKMGSADLEFAVSQACSLLVCGRGLISALLQVLFELTHRGFVCPVFWRRSAGCKPAIQQTPSLRYLLYGLIVLLSTLCRADDLAANFDDANKLYEQGKYPEAIASYEQILKSGRAAAPLYFNLGNAFFKARQIGRAINAYEKAEALSPRDPDILANLRFARNQVQGPTFISTRSQQWLQKLSLNEWTVATCAMVWICLLLLAARFLRPSLWLALRGWAVAAGACAVLGAVLLGLDYYQAKVQPTAVITASSATLHQAPLTESPGPVTLSDGAEVKVLDRKNEWLQVSTDNRRIGWVRRDEVAVPLTD